MTDSLPLSFDAALAGMRAAGEETRLRILALLAESELNVTDLTDILGQSQPRISRHLKLMAEAGLIERHREGTWVFFSLAARGAPSRMARALTQALDRSDGVLLADRARLAAVRAARARAAEVYFARHAAHWDKIRSMHVAEEAVETAILEAIGESRPIHSFLDLGTGTGRMLKLIAPRAARTVGFDISPAMLAVARANIEAAHLSRIELRQGDIYALPVERHSFDLVLVHQVLHFLDDPGRALHEAAQALTPGGRLLVVDFAPHDIEELREHHAHRRLGFSSEAIEAFLAEAGLVLDLHRDLPPAGGESDTLTVSIWLARDPRVMTDMPISPSRFEVA